MSGPRLPTMAWRNLWRNRRRTIITLVSIAFGTLLAVISTGIGDASWAEMIDYAARLGGGHVVVQHPDFAEHPSQKTTIEASDGLLRRLRERPEVRAVAVRINGSAMLSTSTNNVGTTIIGIDPAYEDETTLGLMDALEEGTMLTGANDRGIILGATLAENLGVELGKKVVYTVTTKSGEISSGLARVSGILRTGSVEVDGATCLLPIGSLRKVLDYGPNEATRIAVFIDDHRQAESLARVLDVDLGPGVSVLPWFEAQPDLAGFITMKQFGNVVMQGIITILIAAGIFNTLFVSVMERLREFGILAAIGFRPRHLFGLVLWESLWLALCGILAGVVITAWPYYYLATTGLDVAEVTGTSIEVTGVTMAPVMYVGLYTVHGVVIAAALIFATLTAGLYPAFRAGRVEPVEVIRIV